jgi:hypothetical protein
VTCADLADLPCAVIHNKAAHKAHHDIILPSMVKNAKSNIAISCKASMLKPRSSDIKKQLLQQQPKTTL